MEEFYFVIPNDHSITHKMCSYWFNQNALISAANYFKSGKLSSQNHPFCVNKVQKSIIDCGIFEYYSKYHTFPYSKQQYTGFLNKVSPTYGVCMDMICLPENLLVDEEKNYNTNYKRIDLTVKNAKYNIQNAKNYIPVSVIQGYKLEEYLYCIEEMKNNDCLTPFLGIGSLAVRKKTNDILPILKGISSKIKSIDSKIKLHGFGLSFSVLRNREIQSLLHSSDSLSWFFSLRKFYRVTQFDPVSRRMQEIDVGRKNWDKYVISTFYSYSQYFEYMYKRDPGDFMNEIKQSPYSDLFNLHLETRKNGTEVFRIEDLELLLDEAVKSGFKSISLSSSTHEDDLEINNRNKIMIFNPREKRLVALPAFRNGDKINLKHSLSISISNFFNLCLFDDMQ